jgi:beta-phosphoglucomutase-like phosphatase (HAD superfamily)
VRIAIDIDSTLHHYWEQFAEVALERFGVELPYERQTTWAIDLLAPEQVQESVLTTHTEVYIAAAEPYPGAVETVNAWHAAGHFIHITSHRTTEAHAATARWLRGIGLRYDELYCSYDKIARCREIGIDLLVDDSPVNLERALEAGMQAATITHPWNRTLLSEQPVVGADDWPALAERLAPLLGGR